MLYTFMWHKFNNKWGNKTFLLQNTELKTKIDNIVQLVIPNADIRNAIITPENTIDYEDSPNKCFNNLLSLFNEKCTNSDSVSILQT